MWVNKNRNKQRIYDLLYAETKLKKKKIRNDWCFYGLHEAQILPPWLYYMGSFRKLNKCNFPSKYWFTLLRGRTTVRRVPLIDKHCSSPSHINIAPVLYWQLDFTEINFTHLRLLLRRNWVECLKNLFWRHANVSNVCLYNKVKSKVCDRC